MSRSGENGKWRESAISGPVAARVPESMEIFGQQTESNGGTIAQQLEPEGTGAERGRVEWTTKPNYLNEQLLLSGIRWLWLWLWLLLAVLSLCGCPGTTSSMPARPSIFALPLSASSLLCVLFCVYEFTVQVAVCPAAFQQDSRQLLGQPGGGHCVLLTFIEFAGSSRKSCEGLRNRQMQRSVAIAFKSYCLILFLTN